VDDVIGRDTTWLWRAYAASTIGTWLAFDAFPIVAVRVLHADASTLSAMAAIAVGAAVLAVPLGPWVEYRAKRPVMVGADILRFLVLATVPVAYVAGVLTVAHLVLVTVVVAVADIVFTSASGAFLAGLVPREQLDVVTGRFETAMWISSAVGPPLGGVLVGVVGPVATVTANAASFVASALGLGVIRTPESPPPQPHVTNAPLSTGWRAIAADTVLRALLANTVAVNALIMASAPLLTYLLLHDLAFTPLEYGLSVGLPCLAGVVGARMARPLARRFGRRRVVLVAGVWRVLPNVFLALVPAGPAGLAVVVAIHAATILAMGVFSPLTAAWRLERCPADARTRVLTAWTVTTRVTVAGTTALWGGVAALLGVRGALAAAGIALLATPIALPWRTVSSSCGSSTASSPATTSPTTTCSSSRDGPTSPPGSTSTSPPPTDAAPPSP
jgi:MFS family permease